jgi:hypothetical protein
MIVTRRASAFQAIRDSARLLGRQSPMAVLFVLVSSILVGVGFLLCFVGALVAMPLAILAITAGYRRFEGVPATAAPNYGPAQPGTWPPPPGSWTPGEVSPPAPGQTGYGALPGQGAPPQTSWPGAQPPGEGMGPVADSSPTEPSGRPPGE